MEIKRIGENKIRCALTEEEIRGLGFDIEEIIGNSDMTQKFMHEVLCMVEEQEDIDIELVSPMVKAELLQDHSMAITFGTESEASFKNLMDTVSQIMSHIAPEKLEELRKQSQEEAEPVPPRKKNRKESKVCVLQFASMENMCRMSRVCFVEKFPKSSIYRLNGQYYLALDFTGFSKEEMCSHVFGMVEYDNGHYTETAQIAHIKEQGTCIVKNRALETLMQL